MTAQDSLNSTATRFEKDNSMIFGVVYTVTGIPRRQIVSGDRTREVVYARTIAAFELRHRGLTMQQVGDVIGSDTSTVSHQLRRYNSDPTPYFRDCADRVRGIIDAAQNG